MIMSHLDSLEMSSKNGSGGTVMERILKMSFKERERLSEVKQVEEGKETIKDMARKIGLSYRQTLRVVKRYKEEGHAGLCHRSRGKESNRKIAEGIREGIKELCLGECKGWGATQVSERYEEVYGVKVDHETIRRMMIEWGMYERRRKRKTHRSWRERKEHFGEMIQMDGSFHKWFEGTKEEQCLLVMIDDATSVRMARMYSGETTIGAMELLGKWIERYGIPKSVYADRKNVYVLDEKTEERLKERGEEALTQFGKVCSKLGIEIMRAYSPQAKGRVERANLVFQDRLIKRLKLEGIKDIGEANKYLEEGYLDILNDKFSRKAKSEVDYHRERPSKEEMETILAIEEERKVANDWIVRFENRLYQILSCNRDLPPAKSSIIVSKRVDGSIHFIYRGWEMEAKEITKMDREIKKPEKKNGKIRKHNCKPSENHPWRRAIIGQKGMEQRQ